jgi:hypothetical protein
MGLNVMSLTILYYIYPVDRIAFYAPPRKPDLKKHAPRAGKGSRQPGFFKGSLCCSAACFQNVVVRFQNMV